MIAFILRRFLAMIPLIFGITLLAFALMSLAPGDFLTPVRAQRDVPPELIDAIEKSFGLDQAWYVQYVKWLGNVFSGNLGHSWTYKLPVTDLIGSACIHLFVILERFQLCMVFGNSTGVLTAIYRGSLLDRIVSFLAYSALSIPEFFLALLLVFFAAQTGLFPLGGATSIDYDYMSLSEQFLGQAAAFSFANAGAQYWIYRQYFADHAGELFRCDGG